MCIRARNYQYDLSDERIQNWCEQILNEMAEHYPCLL
ncbi:hypothetical protein NMT90_27395, partial [Escherichia coli]|nr:hypothetical protein [Escherichia coli]